MNRLVAASLLAAALALPGAAMACQGSTVVIEDQFADDSGGWDPSDAVTFAEGMTIDIGAEYTNFKELNVAFAVGDADICADIAFPTGASNNPAGGLMFWSIDYSNFYLLQVSQAGSASLWRLKDGKWGKLYSADVAGIKKEPGAVNSLRVTLKGNTITAYVNGEKFRTQKAQAPKGDSQFGVYVQVDQAAADAAGRTFTVKSYKVTDAPPSS
jgi:hypothetical protein